MNTMNTDKNQLEPYLYLSNLSVALFQLTAETQRSLSLKES